MNLCYEINAILSKFGYFLRVFELKNRFCHLAMKDKTKQKIVRQLSSCLIEKYSGLTIISIEYQKKQRKLFKPIDIIYKPTKHIEIEPLCYFLEDISKAYSSLHSKEKKGLSRSINVFIAINFLLLKQDKKGPWKIAQENQVLFIILITNVFLLINITFTLRVMFLSLHISIFCTYR